MIRPTALPPRGYRSMTGGAGHKGAIRNSPTRPIEAILRLRIDSGARLETFGVTKGITARHAAGRAVTGEAKMPVSLLQLSVWTAALLVIAVMILMLAILA